MSAESGEKRKSPTKFMQRPISGRSQLVGELFLRAESDTSPREQVCFYRVGFLLAGLRRPTCIPIVRAVAAKSATGFGHPSEHAYASP